MPRKVDENDGSDEDLSVSEKARHSQADSHGKEDESKASESADEQEVDSDSGSNGGEDSSEEEDDDEDDSGEDSSDSGDDDDEEDEDSSDSDKEDAAESPLLDADGREMSAYEKLRLDRIRRNQEKLAQLGLEGKDGGGVLGARKQKTKSRKRKKEVIKARDSLSRHTKSKPMNYAEPPSSVAALLRKQASDRPKGRPRKHKDRSDRMDKFIHLEFKRLQGHKTTVKKRTQRFVKHATRELAYWTRRSTGKPAAKLSEEKLANKIRQEEERRVIGGTTKELVQEIDSKMPELLAEVAQYDEKYEAAEQRYEREVKKHEDEHRMNLLDALERFPKALKDSTSLLNAALLERVPKDATAPRRSRRSIEEEEPQTKTKGRPKKKDSEDQTQPSKRKRQSRNVGGWVSPQFAKELDRSWLDNDSATVVFDLKLYVPQVGDVVLYYPAGHRAFMQEYPDWLGRKTKSVSRLPLWERAALEGEREELSKGARKKRGSSMWYTEEWLEGVDGDLGKYPIVCRVHSAHAEFPSDYFVKVVKDGAVSWKAPKESSRKPRDESSSRLRWSIALRPLTPVVPPAWESARSTEARDPRFKDDHPLSPAPLFNVVMFPSKMAPFVVPFAWAYTRSHSIKVGQSVSVDSKKVNVESFEGIASSSFRLDNKLGDIGYILDNFVKRIDQKLVLLDRKTDVTKVLPSPEVQVILDMFDSSFQSKRPETGSAESVSFLALIRSTLPLWDSVTLTSGDRGVCPWGLECKRDTSPSEDCLPQALAASYGLDEPLRARIGAVFDKIVKENPAAEVFNAPVSEVEAPSYHCAVPLAMSFQKVLLRLQPDPINSRLCYYSSVESVISDVSAILDNCLLYNSPESPVVELAADVVAQVKDEILGKSRHHIKEIDVAKKATEDRKLRMMQILDGDYSNDELLRDLFVMNSLKKPFKGYCVSDWLQSVTPTEEDGVGWVPQAGDRIQYSPKLHERFIESHEDDSLEPFHCSIHHLSDDSMDEPEWTGGRVIWTRCSYPKATSKKKAATGSFPSPSTLLVLGIKFDGDNKELAKLRVVCWRPCCFSGGKVKNKACPTCGIKVKSSFLRPDVQQDSSESELLSGDDSLSIFTLLSLLKKRCLKGVPIDYVDNQITKSSLRSGYMPAIEEVSEKSSPLFRESYGQEIIPQVNSASPRKGTRGVKVSVKPKTSDSAIKKLLRSGFLAPFAKGPSGSPDEPTLQRQQSLSPWPKFSLELVQLRLSNGYYRTRSAVENDIIEAYTSVACLLLAEAASRKRDPISMKKIGRALSSDKGRPDSQLKPSPPEIESKNKALSDEESKLISQLRHVRELYATALVSAAETQHVSKLLGLSGPSIPDIATYTRDEDGELETEAQSDARRRLGLLLEAVGRDQLLNTFHGTSSAAPFPTRDVRIVCQRKVVSRQKVVAIHQFALASIEQEEIRVKVRCDKKLLEFERDVPEASTLPAEVEGLDLSLSVVCDDELVTGTPLAQKALVGRRGSKNDLTRNVDRFTFDYEDYEHNDRLTRFFFGRENRMKACARCDAYRRSMLVCRVRRNHSNPDFDWLGTFKGFGGLNNLLLQMRGEPIEELAMTLDDSEHVDIDVDEAIDQAPEKLNDIDPRDLAAKAETALRLATAAAEKGAEYAAAPLRLSKNFIAHTFPIDPSDGHCVYCVICGLSGDLLCCDGCSNVVHGKCVGMDLLPDGDWFCEECQQKEQVSDDDIHQPFDRNEYESEADEKLEELLLELRSAHPDLPKRNRKEKRKTLKPGKNEHPKRQAVRKDGAFHFLAQMARDFLLDSNIATPNELLEARTIDIANLFSKWRRKVGLPILNGGGAGAYVSSWKSTCRKHVKDGDEDEGEDMVVYLSDDGEDEAEHIDSDDADFGERKKRRGRRKGRKHRTSGSRRRRRLDLTTISDPIEGLSEVNRKFLGSMGVVTAAEFLTTRTSDLGVALTKWRKGEGLPPLKGSGVIATVSAAKTLCRKYAVEMGLGDLVSAEPSTRISGKSPARRGRPKKGDRLASESPRLTPPRRGRPKNGARRTSESPRLPATRRGRPKKEDNRTAESRRHNPPRSRRVSRKMDATVHTDDEDQLTQTSPPRAKKRSRKTESTSPPQPPRTQRRRRQSQNDKNDIVPAKRKRKRQADEAQLPAPRRAGKRQSRSPNRFS